MPKKIAVNTRLLLPGKVEGISRFAYEVLKRMVRQHPEVEFHFFFDRKFDPDHIFASNVVPHVLPPQARHPLLWYAWFHLMLPPALKRIGADLFFSPEVYLPPTPSIPRVSVIHDLAYEHFPEDLRGSHAWYMRHFSPRYAKWADHILTVSSFSKEDIVKRYGTSSEKISVVYNGVSDQFRPFSSEEQQQIRDTYTDGKAFFHFVGTLHPRKNIGQLLLAFDRFKSENKSEVKLLLVGKRGWKYREALEIFEQMTYKSEVCFTGFVDDGELSRIYSASMALVYIPKLEGFGIPVLEALRSQTAVICSDNSSLPEVAGKAGLLVEPEDVGAVASAMNRIYREKELRQELIREGQKQLDKYSWDKTYSSVWKKLSTLF